MDFSFMADSIGNTVRLERGGPDKLVGKLLAIMPDCIAVETKNEGVVYVHSQHVKTISEAVIPEIQLTRTGTDYTIQQSGEEQQPLVEAEDFHDLLGKLKHRLVRVNHGGPNSLQGVLIEIRPEAVTILHEMRDYVHYPVFHIKSITWILNTGRESEHNSQGGGGGNKDGGDNSSQGGSDSAGRKSGHGGK